MRVFGFIKLYIAIAFLLLIFSSKGFTQAFTIKKYLDPFSISVVGGSGLMNSHLFDWSFGEAPIIQTLSKNGSLVLTTGFLQNYYDPLLLFDQIDSFALQIKVGPNPFSDHIVINIHQDGINIKSIQVFNFQGKLIHQFEGVYAGLSFYHEIQITKQNIPICYLLIQYTLSNKINKSKIITLIQN